MNELKKETKKKKGSKIGLILIIVLIIIGVIIGIYFWNKEKKDNKLEIKNKDTYSEYRLQDNDLGEFDLAFLKLENDKENKVYSPLAIKYALEMLKEGADDNSYKQINDIIGGYVGKKYVNSENLAIANGLFIKDSYKSFIKEDYVEKVKDTYNADVIYDSFSQADTINNWVSSKTFNLIDKLVDDVKDNDFILTNALAIDMDWKQQIRSTDKSYVVNYKHENYTKRIGPLMVDYYHSLDFDDNSLRAASLEIGAVANRYDIISQEGEDKIRETIKEKYSQWLKDPNSDFCGKVEDEDDVDTYVDKYINEIKANYKEVSGSTDFEFYTDDNVKVFAKDLKEYDGTTLQYIGIMPTNDSLDNYIKNIKAQDIKNIISNLKSLDIDNFKEGVITEVSGYIPIFNFNYKLNLQEDLKEIGVTDVFELEKANLSKLTSSKASINKIEHKANISFSNDGIKASAAVSEGGLGQGFCGFDYLYEVPVEKIDLTFDKPYLFLIRDKKTGEVWFTGEVYEPTIYKDRSNN